MSRSPLDMIEDALIDAEGTASLLTVAVQYGPSKNLPHYVAAIERHLTNDMGMLRKAFTDASRKHGSEKGGEQ